MSASGIIMNWGDSPRTSGFKWNFIVLWHSPGKTNKQTPVSLLQAKCHFPAKLCNMCGQSWFWDTPECLLCLLSQKIRGEFSLVAIFTRLYNASINIPLFVQAAQIILPPMEDLHLKCLFDPVSTQCHLLYLQWQAAVVFFKGSTSLFHGKEMLTNSLINSQESPNTHLRHKKLHSRESILFCLFQRHFLGTSPSLWTNQNKYNFSVSEFLLYLAGGCFAF